MKLITIFLVFAVVGVNAQRAVKYTPKELENWKKLGDGRGTVVQSQFYIEETEGSLGFAVISPEKYNDVVLRYEVMTMNAATVLVALLNASDIGNSTDLTIAADNKGSFAFWTKETESYMFGFGVMAHNTLPFIRKSPVTGTETGILKLAEKEMIHSGWRHLVECGKKDNKLWLKIDNETIIDFADSKPLEAGKIVIRVRGTGSDLGKCLVRNLEIVGDPVK
jgi:ribosomal protein L27